MIATMPRPLPPYVQRHRDRHGKVRFYFRRGKGRFIRLPDPTDKDFHAVYAQCLASGHRRPQDAPSGSLAWLIDRYKESAQFAALASSTRKMRDQVLKRAASSAGHVPFNQIRRSHIMDAMSRRKPNAANNFRKIMHQLFRWAVKMDYLAANPVDGSEPVAVKSDGFHTWSVEEVYQYWDKWPMGTRERLAMDLLLFTGLRRGDAATLGRQHVREGLLSLKTQKTGIWVHVPVLPILQASIDACPNTALAFLVTKKGDRFASAASFGNWFQKACIAAGVPGRAHGLRKAGATIAADAGATAHQLMAMYGWRKIAQAEVYTKSADAKRLARGASEQIGNAFGLNRDPGGLNHKAKQ